MVADATAPVSLKRKQERIPILTRVKVRNLYLYQDLPYRDIAQQCGITEQQVGKVVIAEGLSGMRRKRKQDLIRKSDARTQDEADEVAQAIAAQGDEISLGALEKAKNCIEVGGEYAAKDFQAWTAGLRNVVTVSRLCRGQDQQQQATGASVNVFVLRCGDMDSKRKERAVTAESIPIPAQ